MIWCTCFVPTHTKYKKCNASLSLGINQAICHFHHISIQIKSGRIWKSLWDVYPSYYYKNQRNITKADDVLFLSCDFLALHTYIRQYRNLNLRKFTYNHMKLMNVILQSHSVYPGQGAQSRLHCVMSPAKCQTLDTGAYWQDRPHSVMSGVINKHRAIVKIIVITLML